MRHYCNRQNPSRRETLNPVRTIEVRDVKNVDNNRTANIDSEIILPPGGDYDALEKIENEENTLYIESKNDYIADNRDANAQGGAITQRSGYNKQLSVEDKNNYILNDYLNTNDNTYFTEYIRPEMISEMSGTSSVMSVASGNQVTSMPMYLRRYMGKYLCIDMWTTEHEKLEKCGILTDIGNNFLVIKKPRNSERTLIDLKTIRYISIYCR